MKITIHEIAKKAGVSSSTVSNALNEKKGINEETKKLVKQIATELGYLKPQSSKNDSIKFVIYKRSGTIVTDTPFFSELIAVIEQNFTKHGFDTSIVHITGSEHTHETIRKALHGESLFGLLILATEMLEQDIEMFKDIGFPMVLIDSKFKHRSIDSVTINNYEGAYSAAVHLIEQGHTQIGYFRSSFEINNFYERKAGFEDALKERDIALENKFEYFLEPSFEGSYRDMKKILNENRELPTAVFVDNDVIAFGAIRAIRDHGLNIPNDLSLVAFDDMPFCEISDPRLSSIKLFPGEMANAAVNRLLYKIQNHDKTNHKVEVGTKLIVRESVKSIKN